MCSCSQEGSMEITSFGAILKNLLDRPLKCQLKRFTLCCHLLHLLQIFVISWFSFYPWNLFVPFCPIFCVCLYLLIEDISNPSGLVHVARSLCFVSNSCFACVYHSQRDEESQEIFREIMSDSFKSAEQRIAKNVSSTKHRNPLLFSFVDKPSEIPYTPKKRKSKKRRTKDRANNMPDGNNAHERKAKNKMNSSQPPQPVTHP